MSEALLALFRSCQVTSRRQEPEVVAVDYVRRRFGVWVLEDPEQIKLRQNVLAALEEHPMCRKEIENLFGLTNSEGRRLCGLLVKQKKVLMRKLRTGPHTNTTIYCVGQGAPTAQP